MRDQLDKDITVFVVQGGEAGGKNMRRNRFCACDADQS